MSRATVRSAVATFFAPPAVSGLNYVFTSFPKRITGDQFRNGQSAGTKSGAVGVVHIISEREERIAIGGATSGKKWVHYTVEMQVYMHSVELLAEDAMADFDTVIDNVKAHLRSDRWLNDYPVIFEAGERELSGYYGEPKVLADGASEIWGAVRFEVSEVLTT